MAPWTQWLFQSTESLFRSFKGRTSSSTRPQTMAERQRSPACSMKSMNEAGLFFNSTVFFVSYGALKLNL